MASSPMSNSTSFCRWGPSLSPAAQPTTVSEILKSVPRSTSSEIQSTLPTGDAAKTLGVGGMWYRMPLWLQKSWGSEDHQWTSYGGGGEVIVSAAGYGNGYKDFPFSGLLVQRQMNKKIALGAELFGHGAEGEEPTSELQ